MTGMVGGDGEAQKNFWGVQWGQEGVTHEVIEVKYSCVYSSQHNSLSVFVTYL